MIEIYIGDVNNLDKIVREKTLNKYYVSNIIAYPEERLSPMFQLEKIRKIIKYYNNNEICENIIICTHSPYVLATFNNSLYAYNIANINKETEIKIENIIPRELWLNPKEIESYRVYDYYLKDIFDNETNLIDNIEIDDASKLINEEFDKICEYDTL